MDGINIDNTLQILVAIGAGGLLLEIVKWFLGQGQRRDDSARVLRGELMKMYEDATEEIRQLRNEIEDLWEARAEDLAYTDELEAYIAALIILMREHKIDIKTTRPTRPTRHTRRERDATSN